MSSYWERRAQESRQRSLAAQASRYSGQASQFDNVSRTVGQVSGSQPNSVLEAQRRRREQAERDRLARVQRAQAEARVVEAGRRREVEDAARRPKFALPTGALGPGFQPTVQDYAQAGSMALEVGEEVAFGPERQSVLGGEASRPERTLRDWGLSEQEFRASGAAFDEGRPLAGLGWGALAVAGAVPLFGQAGRGLVKGAGAVGDVVRAAGAVSDAGRAAGAAADVARGAGASQGRNIVSEVAADVVNSANPNYTLPPERLAQVPKGREATAEVFYRQGFDRPPSAVNRQEFQNLATRTDEYIPLYRGIRGGAGSVGSVSTGRPDGVVDAVSAANDFVSGNLYHGGGAGPDGSYFSPLPDVARNYAVGGTELMASSEPGAVISALLPRNARIARLDDPALVREFNDSGYSNIGTFAAAKGYDALLHESGIHIVLNRSALIVDDTPLVYRFGQNVESAADVARAADAGQARIAEIVRNNADELDRIKTERVQQMTRTDEVDQQALARASRAVRDMSPENIWVIHETSFPPMQSGLGVELRPTGDYRPETGRNTVHFTLNHTAAGHEMRGSRSAPYVVVARLSDVLEANPGSLDNLNAIDTFLTPAPGQSLNLPNAVVLQNSQSAQTQTAIRDLVEGSGGTIIDGGKRESLTIGADARIRQLARELNAPSVLHDNHPSYLVEMSHLSWGGMMNDDPLYYLPLMSDNARLRAAQDDIWNRPSAPDRRQMVFKGEDDV